MPHYYKQDNLAACSLAVLRMVLATYGHNISEQQLLAKIEPDYGKDFQNIWNPTIAKLACEFGLRVTMRAEWPLFDDQNLKQAMIEYGADPESFEAFKYENPKDDFEPTEPLTLSYKEMFQAVKLGCGYEYGGMTADLIKKWLGQGHLIQTSIKLERMYPGSEPGFHSILVFGCVGDKISYHDPYRGPNQNCSIEQLLKSSNDVGAVIVYEGLTK